MRFARQKSGMNGSVITEVKTLRSDTDWHHEAVLHRPGGFERDEYRVIERPIPGILFHRHNGDRMPDFSLFMARFGRYAPVRRSSQPGSATNAALPGNTARPRFPASDRDAITRCAP